MSASDVIARLRELRGVANDLQTVVNLLAEYIDQKGTVDVKIALAFETARAALQALAEGGGE
jgi:hypothetical protein